MSKAAGVNGTAVFIVITGSVLLYSGLKGKSISSVVKSLLEGDNPSDVSQSLGITGTEIVGEGINTPGSGTVTTGGAGQYGIIEFLKSKGYSRAAIAGIMGNMQIESGFNTAAINPSSDARGLLQWLGGRKKALLSYAASQGKPWTDQTVQLNFLIHELNTTEIATQLALRGSLTPEAAALAFDKLFERSEGTTVNERQQAARAIYNSMSAVHPR